MNEHTRTAESAGASQDKAAMHCRPVQSTRAVVMAGSVQSKTNQHPDLSSKIGKTPETDLPAHMENGVTLSSSCNKLNLKLIIYI